MPYRQWIQRYSTALFAGLSVFALGVWLGLSLEGSPPLPLFVVALFVVAILGLITVVLAAKYRLGVALAGLVLVGLLGVGWSKLRLQWISPTDIQQLLQIQSQLTGEMDAVVARRQPHPEDATKIRATLALLTVNGQPATGHARLWKTDLPLPPEGTHIRLEGTLRLPEGAAYPGDFNEAKILRSDGVSAVLQRVKWLETVDNSAITRANGWQIALQQYQQRLQRVFYSHLPKAQADMLAGVVLGSRASPIDAAVRQQFSGTGLIHFLAASGLNVGIVAGVVLALGRGLPGRWQLPEKLTILLALVAIAGYALLAGLAPSVLRAAAMLGLALSLRLFNHYWPPNVLLALGVFALALWQPTLLDNLGFQLSILTTLGIILMVPPLQDRLAPYITRWGAALVLVPLVAQIWALPVIASTFHQIAWHSVVLNLLAGLTVAPLTTIGFVTAFLGWLPGIEWATWLAWPFATALLWLAKVGAALPNLVSHPPHWPVWLTVGYFAVLSLATLWLYRPPLVFGQQSSRKPMAVVVCSAMVLWTSWTVAHIWAAQHGELWWISVGKGFQQQHVALLRPAGSRQFIALAEKPLSTWDTRSVSQLQAYLTGTSQVAETLLLTQPLKVRVGEYQLASNGQQAWQITDDASCVLATVAAYAETHRCPLVVWQKPFRAAKLWNNTVDTSQHAQHPTWFQAWLP